MNATAKSQPDGYTLMVIPNELLSVTPLLYKELPFNVAQDLTPIAALANLPVVLAVNPAKLQAKNIAELIAAAKAQPGKLSFGSGGAGTIHHLSLEQFKALAGVDILHVPYKGTAAAVSDLLAGQIDGLFSPITGVLQHIQSGKLHALASAGATRVAALPDTPTVAESGVPGYESPLWVSLSGPAGMPQEVSDFWIAQSKAVFSTEDARKVFGAQGVEPLSLTQAQMRERLVEDGKRWAKVIATAKITVG
jgi:tripartite-type tricarboxylate transporter receptor subunit TctC